MAKYVYPAVFTKSDTDNCVYVNFPDIRGCFTDGKDETEAVFMAEDVLSLFLCSMEDEVETVPAASDISKIKVNKNEFVSLVSCDTDDCREYGKNRLVRKTVSIPNYIYSLAKKRGINFSDTLRDSLKERLQLQ
jgi:predicted RNase H-like HicB family nuclease